MEIINQNRINTLHPKVREEVTKIINECDLILTGRAKIRIAQALRTEKEQNDLYAQGRTKPGKKVTNAKFGQSFHCFGLAVDFVLIIDGKEASWDMTKDWDGDHTNHWQEIVNVYVKYGWEWGGNLISLKDFPHFQKVFGYTWQQLLMKHSKNDFIPGTQFVNI